MMRQETPLYLLPYQQAVLDADRLISSPPPTSNVVSGFSGHVLVDEFDSLLIDMQDYLPGGDFPLTYEQALDQARQGSIVECSFGRVRYQYEADADCITCIDMEQPSDAERCCGWQVVPSDNN